MIGRSLAGALVGLLLASGGEAQERPRTARVTGDVHGTQGRVDGGDAPGGMWVEESGWAWARPEPPAPWQLRPSESTVLPAAMSAVVPGSGQLALGRRRGWIYLGLELVAWLGYADRRGAAAAFRDQYRDVAWEHARSQNGPRLDGGFRYYETLTQWTRSGAFDGDASAPELQPETDPTTFNGSIWQRARGLFMSNGSGDGPTHPGYAAAVRYYRERAYDERFLWDWSNDPDARGTFASLIDASDVRARQATAVLGLVIANHLVAAADGFLAARGLSAQVGPDIIRISWRTPR